MTPSPGPATDPLEEALVRPPYLDGPEFTQRVLASLPPPRRRARGLILAAGGLGAGAVAAALVLRAGGELGPALQAVLSGGLPAAGAAAALGIAFAAGVAGWALAAGEGR